MGNSKAFQKVDSKMLTYKIYTLTFRLKFASLLLEMATFFFCSYDLCGRVYYHIARKNTVKRKNAVQSTYSYKVTPPA